MIIGIIINNIKSEALICAKKVVGIFSDEGAKVIINSRFRESIEDVIYRDTPEEIIKDSDIIVTIGGDGTIIKAGKTCAKEKKPLIGINLGRVGFVAGIESYELDLLRKIMTGDYKTQKRMLIDCIVHKKDAADEKFTVLNEITLQRDVSSSVIELEVSLNKERIITYRADGIIFATATGSTAYSFSAGGPVIEPDMECIILNPICPHALSSRQVIFSSESVLDVRIAGTRTESCYLVADGKISADIGREHDIELRRSDLSLELILLKEKNFYTLLNEKLKEGN